MVTRIQWARRFLVLLADGRLFIFKANPTATTAPITYLPVTATLTTFSNGTLSAVQEENIGEGEQKEEGEHQQRDRYVITASGVGLTLAGQVQQRLWLLTDVGDDSADGNTGGADTDDGRNAISDLIVNWSAAFDFVLADTSTISPLAPPSPESPLAVFGASSTATAYASSHSSYSSHNSYNSYNNPYNNLYSNYNNYSPLDYFQVHENITYSPVSPASPTMPSIPTMQRTFSSPIVDYLAVGERSTDGFEMRRSMSSKSVSNNSGGFGGVNSVSHKPPRPHPENSQAHAAVNNFQQAPTATAKTALKSASSRKTSWLDFVLNPV
ncbi:hypothetical protein HK100_011364 [Physocladia obscura]|uniref:PH domain-containing protein n=1 Tax=Physocladia obscura TaxID=109957 RepID=A0AAD5XH05_9FUNG|nr:hypothetical protein HK100_011364 [Physocladia obscura]